MAEPIRLLHNPRCSKSRAALALLEQQGYAVEPVLYLENPLSAAELQALCQQLGIPPRALLRKEEPVYRELGLSDLARNDQALLQAMAEHPKLIQRPVAVGRGKAVIGRPPEAVLTILSPAAGP